MFVCCFFSSEFEVRVHLSNSIFFYNIFKVSMVSFLPYYMRCTGHSQVVLLFTVQRQPLEHPRAFYPWSGILAKKRHVLMRLWPSEYICYGKDATPYVLCSPDTREKHANTLSLFCVSEVISTLVVDDVTQGAPPAFLITHTHARTHAHTRTHTHAHTHTHARTHAR